jgi:aminomethyltransferase
MNTPRIRPTPFHARAAANNPFNRWISRNGFTLTQDYGDAQAEALAARTNAVLVDISWRWRVVFEGPQAAECVARLVTKNVNALAPSQSLKALWLNDSGAVRGAGVVARYASDQFLIASASGDTEWFSRATQPFDLSLRDATERDGGVALIGPYAGAILQAVGLDADLAPLSFHKLFWRGLDVTLSRWGEQGGYEIWCKADDCFVLWDRLMHAGEAFGIRAAGSDAADILDIEMGVPRPDRDYRATKESFEFMPSPRSLGLESLIDDEHLAFNGRRAFLEARSAENFALVGLTLDTEIPVPFSPLVRSGQRVGKTLTSVHSPMLRRAIALAQVEKSAAAIGTEFSVALPLSLDRYDSRSVSAHVAELPFVALPEVEKG